MREAEDLQEQGVGSQSWASQRAVRREEYTSGRKALTLPSGRSMSKRPRRKWDLKIQLEESQWRCLSEESWRCLRRGKAAGDRYSPTRGYGKEGGRRGKKQNVLGRWCRWELFVTATAEKTRGKKRILGTLERVKEQSWSPHGPGRAGRGCPRSVRWGSTRRWQQPSHADKKLLCCLTPLAGDGDGALAIASAGNCAGKSQSFSRTAAGAVCELCHPEVRR